MDKYLEALSTLFAEEKYLDMVRIIITLMARGPLTVNEYGNDECPYCVKVETPERKGGHCRNCPVVLARLIDKEWRRRREKGE